MLILGGMVTIGYTFLYGLRNAIAHAILTSAMAIMLALVGALIISLDHTFTGPTAVGTEAFEVVLGAMNASS